MGSDATAWVLLGPTASGKSALAMRLAARFPIEIVSLDSAQAYRSMDIGTAKPTRAERARVPHHLLDMVEPTENYSAGRFCRDTLEAVHTIRARGHLPLIVGGTMLYYRALASGLHGAPDADPILRAEINDEANRRGWPALHADLMERDPAAARHIAPRDAQRIQRALEIIRRTGRTLSSVRAAPAAPAPLDLRAVALLPPDRSTLHHRIAERFDSMLALGFIDEVETLRRTHPLTATSPSMRTVGYRQIWGYLEGRYDRNTMRDQALAATRQFAKRQMTWLRSFRLTTAQTAEEAEDQFLRDFERESGVFPHKVSQ